MKNRTKRRALDALERADLLLMSMGGQMDMLRERSEHNGQPAEYNDLLHVSVCMKTMIDSVRAALDDCVQHVTTAEEN